MLAVCSAAFGQIKVDAPSVVAVGENFNIVFTVENQKPSDFQWNPQKVESISLVWGPQTGSSTSIRIVNGKRESTSSFTYTYVMQANAEGQYNVPAATAKVKGGSISSSPMTIKVVKSSSKPSNGGSASAGSSTNISPDDLFIRMSISKRDVVVGEPVKVDIKLYSRVNIAGFEDVQFPSFSGFWSQETYTAQNVEFKREALGDEIYNSVLLRSYSLIPQQLGDLAIDPAEIVCLINVRTAAARTGSIFDSFFQDDYRTIRKRVATRQETIHVRALPQPQPESFCGGVGNFSISSSLTRDSLKAHDAASYVLTVRSNSNLTLLEAPKVKMPADFDLYDVKISEQNGSKIFEYPFIPRAHGEFLIEPVEFSYYDLASRSYKTITAAEQRIVVERNAASEGTAGGSTLIGGGAKDIRDIGSDIRYIASKEPSWRRSGSFFVLSVPFLAIVLLLLIGAVALVLAVRKTRSLRADVEGSRKRGASKMAKARLKRAGEFLQQNLYSAFYEELHRALLGFASDRLTIDGAELDKSNIVSKMVEAGASQADADAFAALLDACEFARYAPSAETSGMNSHYETALGLISILDSSMKKKTGKGAAAAVMALLLMMVPAFGVNAQDFQEVDPGFGQEQPVSGLWQTGLTAYSAGNWDEALQAWEMIAESGVEAPQLWYNMGCASFKKSDFAHAVLYFQRALKLDPSYKDAQVNLEFTRLFLQDKIEEVPEFFLVSWIKSVRHSLSSNVWAWIFIVLFAAALAMVALFVTGRSTRSRKLGFFLGIAFLMLSLAALGSSIGGRAESLKQDRAVVMASVCVVRSAPDNHTGTDLFVLHEGACVKLLDQVGSWRSVALTDGRQGWLESSSMEII